MSKQRDSLTDAAPDLLDALKGLRRGLVFEVEGSDCWCSGFYLGGYHEPQCERVKRAIAKAEGRE